VEMSRWSSFIARKIKCTGLAATPVGAVHGACAYVVEPSVRREE
jgi:hypothetical protein